MRMSSLRNILMLILYFHEDHQMCVCTHANTTLETFNVVISKPQKEVTFLNY